MEKSREKQKRGRPKRKAQEEDTSVTPAKMQQVCILHYSASSCDSFTLLADLKDPQERFQKLLDIRALRLSQSVDSNQRMESVCELIPNEMSEGHGYHRDCYNHFTKHVDRLKCTESTELTESTRKVPRKLSVDKIALFAKDCIFCNKAGAITVRKAGTKTTEVPQKFASDGWKTIVQCAESKNDEKLLVRIRGYDLFASEAHFHAKCRRKYIQDPQYWRSQDTEAKLHQEEKEAVHAVAFTKVCEFVSKEVLNNQTVVKLTDLVQLYVNELDSSDFPNPNYRSEKLKDKLESKYGKLIEFCKIESTGRYVSLLVYNAKMKVETAVMNAFQLGSRDLLKESAAFLRETIKSAFENSKDLSWPPLADQIDDSNDVIPSSLSYFLKYIFSGKVKDTSIQVNRLVSSIGQDICRVVTNGDWKLPKHILLGMTIRHLYRSKQLTTLLNRLGHCESHSFSAELETSIAKALDQSSSLLTPQIVREPDVPSIFHSEFDNFDQLVNTMSGTDSVHTAHGIMLQEVLVDDNEEHGGTVPIAPSLERTKERSLNLPVQQELPVCYVGQRKSPNYPFAHTVLPDSEESVVDATDKDIVWLFMRKDMSSTGQNVPGWAGFVSVTGSKPIKLTTIDYYPVINHPITDYSTVQECLRFAEEATREVGQTYTVTTFDLGVCMKALPLIWNNPDKYKNHIVMVGTFHLVCAYLKMIGKKMAGSGLADVLLEAGLIGSGSVNGVLNGKHYERAMHCHKILLESLERMLLDQFLEQGNEDAIFESLPEETRDKINNLILSQSQYTMDELMSDDFFISYIRKYAVFKKSVRDGALGKTARFWISYMDHIWLVLSLIRAVKTNDFNLYAQCLHLMADIFFSFDGQNYARYVSYFSVFVANLDENCPGASELLQRGAISVARSFIPGNRCAVDKTMEETFMKHAKSRSGAGGSGTGISGIAGNYDAYQRWVRTTHERSKYVEATLNMADMLADSESSTWHRDLRPAEIQKGDREVCETQEAILGFTNPFTIDDKDNLYCISSGARVPKEHEKDILSAELQGKQAKEQFIQTRLEKGENFFEPIKRKNLKTMEAMGKNVKVKTANNKIVQYRQQGNVAMQLLVRSQTPELRIDLADLMKYPLTPVPFSIGTADGCFAKTDKSKGLKYLIDGTDTMNVPPQDKTVLLIEDGNALFHSIKEIPSNFRQISEKLFTMTSQKVDVIFSTDMYKENSVKSMERSRRGSSEKLLLQGENTKKPADWKSFLTNDENKKQLVQVLLSAWANDIYAKKLQGRKVVLICEGDAYCYTSEDGIKTERTMLDGIKSTQEETDTRIILYCLYAQDLGYKIVQVRTPDSDIFFILLHYIDRLAGITVLFDTGSGKHRKLINMTEIGEAYTPERRAALLALHAFCGCDTTSAFKGRGHVLPIKTLEKLPRFSRPLASLGESWEVGEDLLSELEQYTCAMYGNSRFTSVDELRLFKLKEKCDGKPATAMRNMDMGTLPPCRKCLVQHVRRVNYQVAVWKSSHIAKPNIPQASERHGWTRVDGVLEPLWIEGQVLPQRLADILQDTMDVNSDEEEEEESDDEVEDALD